VTVLPRSLVHRGYVDAVGMVFSRAVHEAEARRRVLAVWSPGTRVFALGPRYAVMFPAPRRVRAEQCTGTALVRLGTTPGLVSAAPLTPTEVRTLLAQGARPEGIVWVSAGLAEPLSLPASSLVDPAAWIDLDALQTLAVTPLGPPPPVVVIEAPPTHTKSLRPATAAPVGDALLRSLSTLLARAGRTPDTAAETDATAALAPALHAAVRALPPPEGASAESQSGAMVQAPARGWWWRLREWVHRRWVGARMRRILGVQQARDLDAMIAMFRAGDLDAALRHALPLGASPGPGVQPDKPISLDPLPPRDRLDIRLAPATHTTGAGGGSLHALLTNLYREAAQSLEADGRIDEAAFVLAELMRLPGEAVALLERHGRYALAAELAETARLPPEQRVRQWLLAGETARALGVLRIHQGFVAAQNSLAKDPALLDTLHTLWAEHLASVGDFAAARKVASTVPALAPSREAWGDALLALGGPVGIAVLVERLAETPSRWESLRDRVEALALSEGPAGLRDRSRFAVEAARLAVTPTLATAARRLVRPQARDAARTSDPADLQALTTLVQVAGDPLLRADLPYWPTFARAPLSARSEPMRLVLDAADTGPTPVWDAAALPDGGMLLAFGEAGVSLRSPDGTPRHLDATPCHRLVLSDRADRALLLAARDTSWSLARWVLPDGPATPWGACTLDAFAHDYDGDVWVVGQGGSVIALDAQAPRIKALHGPTASPYTDGTRVACVARDTTSVTAVRRMLRWERWRWHLPGWSMLERTAEPADHEAVAVHPSGAAVRVRGRTGLYFDRGTSQPVVDLPRTVGAACTVAHLNLPWIVLLETTAEAVTVVAWHLPALRTVLTVRLEGARRAWARVCGDVLTACDDRGRVLAVHLGTGQRLHDLRV